MKVFVEETKGLGAGSYPMAPEKDETEITIHLELKTTDIFPESWDKQQIEDYIRGNIKEYLLDSDIEIHEIDV
jgi:hypothetical protein